MTLKIGDRELGFSFGLAFLGELLEQTDLSIDEIVSKMNRNPFKMIPTIMYYSTKLYSERRGEEFVFSLFDVTDWLDEAGGVGNENVAKFLKAFTSSLTKDVPKEDEVPDKDSPKKK